jgi:hypothetical protein
MLFNVPQYIDVEDKIAGPFTAKQLLWLFGMGGVLLLMWGFLDKVTFFISAVPVALIFCTLAFYRPHGQPLIRFVIWGISFMFHPKIFIWRRDYIRKKSVSSNENKNGAIKINELEKIKEKKKNILVENIEGLSRTLDTEGKERNEKILEIIKQNREKNKK